MRVLEEEKAVHETSRLHSSDPKAIELLNDVVRQLDVSIRALQHVKQKREDSLSFYEGMLIEEENCSNRENTSLT
jgi:hypothetical protein